jgi:hypothetical protein
MFQKMEWTWCATSTPGTLALAGDLALAYLFCGSFPSLHKQRKTNTRVRHKNNKKMSKELGASRLEKQATWSKQKGEAQGQRGRN